MRVCHIVRQYHPSIGGIENFVAALCAAQKAQGVECEGPRLPAEEIIDGVRVRRVPMVGARRYFCPLMHNSALDGFDIVHVHAIDGLFEAAH